MKELWARLGVTMSLTDAECEDILGDECDAGRVAQILHAVVTEGRFRLDGDSYIPSQSVALFNDEYDTDYMECEVDCIV